MIYLIDNTIEGQGRKSVFKMEGIGEARGDTFKNPVTGTEHLADLVRKIRTRNGVRLEIHSPEQDRRVYLDPPLRAMTR